MKVSEKGLPCHDFGHSFWEPDTFSNLCYVISYI
jgi:hypothetical protein